MPGEDKLLGFYNTLKESGAVEGLPDNYDSFKQGLSDSENAQGFFDAIHSSGAVDGLPDNYDSFASALGLPGKERAPDFSQSSIANKIGQPPGKPVAPSGRAPLGGSQSSGASSIPDILKQKGITPPKKVTEFETRFNKPEQKIDNGDGSFSTHKMASAEIEGVNVAFPTIVNQNGKLVELPIEDAIKYAGKTGEYKVFPDAQSARQYAEGGYKNGTKLQEGANVEGNPVQLGNEGLPDLTQQGIGEQVAKNAPEGTGQLIVPAKEEKSFGAEMVNSIARGSDALGAGLARSPAFLYDIASIPQNVMAQQAEALGGATGVPVNMEGLKTNSNEFGKQIGVENNKIAQFYEKSAEERQKSIQEKYDKGVTDYFSNGEYSKGFGLLANQIAESAPVTLSLMMGNAAGVGTTGSILGGGAVFGAEKKKQLDKDAPWLTEQEKLNIALMNGLAEGVFEQFGLTKIGGAVKNVLRQSGKEAAEKLAKDGFMQTYGKLVRGYLGTTAEEGLSEAATQFAQNVIDKYGGADPNLDLRKGVSDAFLVGIGAGSSVGAAPAVLQVAKTKQGIKQQQQIQQQRDAISQSVEDPNIAPQAKEALVNKVRELNQQEGEVVQNDNDAIAALPDEAKQLLGAIDNHIQGLAASLQSEGLTPEARQVIEEQLTGLDAQKDDILAQGAALNEASKPLSPEQALQQKVGQLQAEQQDIEGQIAQTNEAMQGPLIQRKNQVDQSLANIAEGLPEDAYSVESMAQMEFEGNAPTNPAAKMFQQNNKEAIKEAVDKHKAIAKIEADRTAELEAKRAPKDAEGKTKEPTIKEIQAKYDKQIEELTPPAVTPGLSEGNEGEGEVNVAEVIPQGDEKVAGPVETPAQENKRIKTRQKRAKNAEPQSMEHAIAQDIANGVKFDHDELIAVTGLKPADIPLGFTKKGGVKLESYMQNVAERMGNPEAVTSDMQEISQIADAIIPYLHSKGRQQAIDYVDEIQQRMDNGGYTDAELADFAREEDYELTPDQEDAIAEYLSSITDEQAEEIAKQFTEDQANEILDSYEQDTTNDTGTEQDSENADTGSEREGKSRPEKPEVRVKQNLESKGSEPITAFEKRESDKKEALKLHERLIDIIRKYAPKAKILQGNTGSRALGLFFKGSKNIAIHGLTDISVGFHELSHAIDDQLGITKSVKEQNLRGGLEDLYLNYYPGASPKASNRTKMLEGYAMLLQKHIESPSVIESQYPELVQAFLTPDGKYAFPDILEFRKDAEKLVRDYYALNPLEQVGSRVADEAIPELPKGVTETLKRAADKTTQEIADNISLLENLTRRDGSFYTTDDAAQQMRMSLRAVQVAGRNIEGNNGYWALNNKGEWEKKYDFNWKTIYEDLEKEEKEKEFGHFLIARRAYFDFQKLHELEDRVETDPTNGPALKALEKQKGIIAKDAFNEFQVTAAYNQNKEQFTEQTQKYDALMGEQLNLLAHPEVGLISDATAEGYRKEKGYASFARYMFDEFSGESEKMGGTSGGKKPGSLKERKGSQKPFLNPLVSGISSEADITRKAMWQAALNKIGKMADRNPELMGDMIQKVPIETNYNTETGKASFPQERDPNHIVTYTDGKRDAYKIGEDIKRVIEENSNYENVHLIFKLFQASARLFRTGTTGWWLPFITTNLIMDNIAATANSKTNFLPVISSSKELFTSLANKDSDERKFFNEYMWLADNSQTSGGWDKQSFRTLDIKMLNKSWLSKAKRFAERTSDILSAPANYSEILTRSTEYIRARKMGYPQKIALEMAGRVSAPFHHRGSFGGGAGREILRTIPYANASIQVMAQTLRTLRTPEGQRRMLFVMSALSVAQVAATLSALDDDEEKERLKNELISKSPEELGQYVYIKNPVGKGLSKIRVPENLSTPSTLINMAMLSSLADADYSKKEWFEGATTFAPDIFKPYQGVKWLFGIMPQFVKGGVEVATNKTTYPTVRDIETMADMRLPVDQRSNQWTSPMALELARTDMAKELSLSPKKIDHLVGAYGGRTAQLLTGKSNRWNQLLNLFESDMYLESGRQVRMFYDYKKDNEQLVNSVRNIVKTKTGLKGVPAEDLVDEYKNTKDNTYTPDEVKKALKSLDKIELVDKKIDKYRKIDPEKEPKKAARVISELYKEIEKLDIDGKGKEKQNEKYWDNLILKDAQLND